MQTLKRKLTWTNITELWVFIQFNLLTILEQTRKMSSSKFNQPWINQKINKLTGQKKRIFKKDQQDQQKNHLDKKYRLKAQLRKNVGILIETTSLIINYQQILKDSGIY